MVRVGHPHFKLRQPREPQAVWLHPTTCTAQAKQGVNTGRRVEESPRVDIGLRRPKLHPMLQQVPRLAVESSVVVLAGRPRQLRQRWTLDGAGKISLAQQWHMPKVPPFQLASCGVPTRDQHRHHHAAEQHLHAAGHRPAAEPHHRRAAEHPRCALGIARALASVCQARHTDRLLQPPAPKRTTGSLVQPMVTA